MSKQLNSRGEEVTDLIGKDKSGSFKPSSTLDNSLANAFPDKEFDKLSQLHELTREQLQSVCEDQLGMAVYDDEPDSDLIEAIADSINEVTLPE